MATIEVIGQKIIDHADDFINLYEIKANAEWRSIVNSKDGKTLSDLLVKEMERGGWQKGWPYCMAFAEAAWRYAYEALEAPEALRKEIFTKLTPSSMVTYNNFKAKITKTPVPGAIFLMQHGKTSNGHAGIVCGVKNGVMATIEGNTSSKGATSVESDRNGDCIVKKTRPVNFSVSSGLYLKGFLNPIPW